FASPHTPYPRAHLLSNGDLTAMVTNAGGGFIRWREMDLTRWRADTTKDEWGTFIYLKDLRTGAVWSAAYQPLGQTGRHYAANFSVDRAEFRRRDHGIECLTEIAVSPEDDAEVRRLTLVNLTGQRRELEITSFMELALAPHAADRAHPAFNKLFVATEALPEKRALIAWRRRRTPEEQPFWAGHVLAMENEAGSPVQFETDRRRFLGRGGCARRPAALSAGLSGTAGFVLDPVFSLRCRVAIEPGQSMRLAFVTVAGESRRTVLDLVGKYGNPGAARDALEMAWTRAQLELRHLGIEAEDARSYQELASHALYPNPRLRPTAERLRRNALGQSRLWAYGISGDLPILTISVNDPKELHFAREMLIAHTYLRLKGLKADLVILNGEAPTYGQPLQEELRRLIAAHSLHTGVDRPGGIFLRAAAQMPEEDLTLILAVSRAVLVAARGPLAQQLTAADSGELPPRLKPNRRLAEEPSAPLPFLELPYFNGLGGFTPDGREYAIYLGPGVHTPAPWVNIIANPDFGTLVSQDGTGFTWYGNSQTNRLSPWTNDPVADPSTDAVYIRDEETGVFWSPTPAPVREQDAYRARHGQGYTVFEHNSHAIEQELTVFVPVDDEGGAPIRLQRLRLINRSSRPRRLSVWAYTEWTLGVDREETQPHLVTRWDRESQVLLARNAYHPDYPRRVAFTAMSPPAESYTADRTEFLGRNGTPAHPAALDRRHLGGRTGPGLDACSAQQVTVELEPGGAAEVVILLGQGADVDEVRRLVRYYRDPFRVQEAFEAVRAFWDGLLGTVQVRTPYLAVNFLLNRWLLYQTLSCRIWARSSLYQSGGAYGFRDQLQDVLAVVHTAPGIAREHLLRAAGR
ncbi:MAG: GH36-type glycosyl hydrolase domain-containing protein, partial [Bacteroidota bacterium]